LQGKNTIACDGEIVARRTYHGFRPQYAWDGAVPLVATWRGCSVRYRDLSHRLLMCAGSGCRKHKVVLRPSLDPALLPICFGIVLATFVDI